MTSQAEELQRRKWALAERYRAVDNLMWKCCVNCAFFDQKQAWCQKWSAQPPPMTIVVGCEEYIEHIPF